MAAGKTSLTADLQRLGVNAGDLVMVHSSLRSLGMIDEGAQSVVDAFLDALGPSGTLVGPSFTFGSVGSPSFVFDVLKTPSEMGAVSEEIRRRAGRRRSAHASHSVSVIGPLAPELFASYGESAWDSESPLAKVIQLGGKFLLLGVTYQSFTAVHVLEIEFGLRHRSVQSIQRKYLNEDGVRSTLASTVYPRDTGYPGYDFNRLGQAMEEAGIVKAGPVANAVGRLVPGDKMRSFAAGKVAQDPNYLLQQSGSVTSLQYGATVELERGDLSVLDPTAIYTGS